jgi:hypothetical protein
MGFGHEPEQMAVAVEAPGPALLNDGQACFIVPIEQLVGDTARGVLIREFERLRAKPLHADDCHEALGKNATDRGERL